jgi:ribonuclease D
MTDPIFINTNAQLAAACEGWLRLDTIGLDTEFERTRTYYSRPALVQVFDGERVSLVDPLAIDDFESLAALLASPGVTKIMHAAEGDMEVLEQLTGVVPVRVFDTQLAAAFTGHGFSLGYRSLTQMLLGEEISKGETRSDWLRRPLSGAQISYAALDVLHLLRMHELLRRELDETGRAAWLEEETERVQRRRDADRDPRRAYLRIRQGRRLEGGALRALRDLAEWREHEARNRDLPRQMVVRDVSLTAIASARRDGTALFADIPEFSDKTAHRYGGAILEILDGARADDSEAPPSPPPTIERRHANWLKSLKGVLQSQANTLGVPAPLLAQTRTLEALVATAAAGSDALPEELQGWRAAAIGDQLRAALEGIAEDP